MNETLLRVALVTSLGAVALSAQTSQSAEGLVASLTKQKVCTTSAFTKPHEKRQAMALLALGDAALPAIAKGLDVLLEHPNPRALCGAEWFLYAFARIRGAAAYPRLTELLVSPQLRPLNRQIENAMVVSLGLTSLVSALDVSGQKPGDTRAGLAGAQAIGYEVPQSSVDLFLLGWIQGRDGLIEESLSPVAREEFRRLRSSPAWDRVRYPAALDERRSILGVGYKLSLPGGMVDLPGSYSPLRLNEPHESKVSGRAEFYSNGKSCAEHTLHFLDVAGRSESPGLKWHFVIDNSDIEALLNSLKKCM